jgi:hypothetical protein
MRWEHACGYRAGSWEGTQDLSGSEVVAPLGLLLQPLLFQPCQSHDLTICIVELLRRGSEQLGGVSKLFPRAQFGSLKPTRERFAAVRRE